MKAHQGLSTSTPQSICRPLVVFTTHFTASSVDMWECPIGFHVESICAHESSYLDSPPFSTVPQHEQRSFGAIDNVLQVSPFTSLQGRNMCSGFYPQSNACLRGQNQTRLLDFESFFSPVGIQEVKQKLLKCCFKSCFRSIAVVQVAASKVLTRHKE